MQAPTARVAPQHIVAIPPDPSLIAAKPAARVIALYHRAGFWPIANEIDLRSKRIAPHQVAHHPRTCSKITQSRRFFSLEASGAGHGGIAAAEARITGLARSTIAHDLTQLHGTASATLAPG